MKRAPPASTGLPEELSPEEMLQGGWDSYTSASPFTAAHGRMYQKIDPDGTCWRAFRARSAHCNAAGIVHGGMLATFMDALMGMCVAQAAQRTALTIRLTTDFLSIARPGDWIEGHSRVAGSTRSVAFVTAEAFVASRPLITAQGVFKLMRRREFRKKP